MEENKAEKKKINSKQILLVIFLILLFDIVVLAGSAVNEKNKELVAVREWTHISGCWDMLDKGAALFDDGTIYKWGKDVNLDKYNPHDKTWILKNSRKSLKKVSAAQMAELKELIKQAADTENNSSKTEASINYNVKHLNSFQFDNWDNYSKNNMLLIDNNKVTLQKVMSRETYDQPSASDVIKSNSCIFYNNQMIRLHSNSINNQTRKKITEILDKALGI